MLQDVAERSREKSNMLQGFDDAVLRAEALEDQLVKSWRPPSLVEKLLSGGGIKVTKGAWQVPKWLAFVASQVVLLGETW
jgi:hypothetical protein